MILAFLVGCLIGGGFCYAQKAIRSDQARKRLRQYNAAHFIAQQKQKQQKEFADPNRSAWSLEAELKNRIRRVK
jgi:hypothetical protein